MTTNFVNLISKGNSSNIKEIQFGVMSSDLVKKGSVCKVEVPALYVGNTNAITVGGPLDLRMGPSEPNVLCETCEQDVNLCPGHHGHIELVMPVYVYKHMQTIMNVLSCICLKCSNLLVGKSTADFVAMVRSKKKLKRLVELRRMSKNVKECAANGGCNAPVPVYKLIKPEKNKDIGNKFILYIEATFVIAGKKQPVVITPQMCLNIFKRITDEDCQLLGFDLVNCRPDWLIVSNLLVPPPIMRPSVHFANQVSEDDLTYCLTQIVKYNNSLREKISALSEQFVIDEQYSLLQFYVITYFNNKITNFPQHKQRQNGRVIKSVEDRFKGGDTTKSGNIRKYIMGKRVDFSARTVISCDPNLDIDQLGVPIEIAKIETVPVAVNADNIGFLQELLRAGPDGYPTIKTIIQTAKSPLGPSKRFIFVTKNNYGLLNLRVGDVVNRTLMNDDRVLFNRQPSLHKMSMMSHRVRVFDHLTFRLNVLNCKPYNADFDGDEMNMHVPQSVVAASELNDLCLTTTQIISISNSKPIIGIEQDTAIGAYLMTKKNEPIPKYIFFNLLMKNTKFNIDKMLKKIEYGRRVAITEGSSAFYSGKELFSMLLPVINFKKSESSDSNDLVIVDGIIRSGHISTKMLNGNNLMNVIGNIYDNREVIDFLNNIYWQAIQWLNFSPASVGFSDMTTPRELDAQINAVTADRMAKIDDTLNDMKNGTYRPELSVKLRGEALEIEIGKKISEMSDEIYKTIVRYNEKNEKHYLKQSMLSGTKGSSENIRQIMGTVGQVELMGERIKLKFTERTLPHFARHDDSIQSKGYCPESFSRGLGPISYFFHAMGGRVGVMDTAVKTATSGYISRKLMKGMEDLVVSADYSIRNSFGKIVQFTALDDMMDPSKLVVHKLALYSMSDDEMRREFDYGTGSDNSEYVALREMREALRTKYFPNLEYTSFVECKSPIRFAELIVHVQRQFGITEFYVSDLTRDEVKAAVAGLVAEILDYFKGSNPLTFLTILIYSTLSSKQCIEKYRLSKIAFDFLIKLIRKKVIGAFLNVGEMIGPISAQSIGEYSTQMTLNTFHLAGISSNKAVMVTKGTPRMDEIISVKRSESMRTPSMVIYLKPEFRFSKDVAEQLKKDLQYIVFSSFVVETSIVYEKSDRLEDIVPADRDWIELDYRIGRILAGADGTASGSTSIGGSAESPFVLRFIFDKIKMISYEITMEDIVRVLRKNSFVNQYITISMTDNNAQNLIMRVKFASLTENGIEFIKKIEQNIMKIVIRGSAKIKTSKIEKRPLVVFDELGAPTTIEEYTLNTDGTDLLTMMSNAHIDITRTVTNDIYETYQIFGVEAARAKIVKEFVDILSSPDDIDYRHIALLADTMTYRGRLIPFTKNGFAHVDNGDYSVIGKASFEQVTNVLQDACLNGKVDNMRGVSANIMMAQPIAGGTNAFELFINEEIFFANFTKAAPSMQSRQSKGKEPAQSVEDKIKHLHDDIPYSVKYRDDDFELNKQVVDNVEHNIGAAPKLKFAVKIRK